MLQNQPFSMWGACPPGGACPTGGACQYFGRHGWDVHPWAYYTKDYKTIHKGGIRILEMHRWGMARNRLETTDLNYLSEAIYE